MPKRLLRVILSSLAALACLWTPAPSAQETAPLTLLVFNRPPYYILDNGKAADGFLLAVALAVFERAGIPLTIREMPPSRIVASLTADKAGVCAVGWIKTPQREAFARFSRPLYHDQPMVAAVSSARAVISDPPPSLGDLLRTEMTWGLREGFSYGKDFDQAFAQYPANRIKRFSDTLHLVELLAQGRLDALLLNPAELAWIIANHPGLGPKIRIVPLADAQPGPDRHIMCSQSVAPETMARLDAAIRDFVSTEQYRSLTAFSLPY